MYQISKMYTFYSVLKHCQVDLASWYNVIADSGTVVHMLEKFRSVLDSLFDPLQILLELVESFVKRVSYTIQGLFPHQLKFRLIPCYHMSVY